MKNEEVRNDIKARIACVICEMLDKGEVSGKKMLHYFNSNTIFDKEDQDFLLLVVKKAFDAANVFSLHGCYKFDDVIDFVEKFVYRPEMVHREFVDAYKKAELKNDSYKNDRLENKVRWELFPYEELEEVCRLYEFGCEKYSEGSWKDIPDGYKRCQSAMLRHLAAHKRGEEIDEETKLPHLASVVWNAITMYYHYKKSNKK